MVPTLRKSVRIQKAKKKGVIAKQVTKRIMGLR